MDVVLYTEDFEPITAIPLQVDLDQLTCLRMDRFRLPVPWEVQYEGRKLGHCPREFHTVTIRLEPLTWKDGSRKWILIAEDEVMALKLRPSWLPGQRGTVNDYRQAITNLATLLVQAMGGE